MAYNKNMMEMDASYDTMKKKVKKQYEEEMEKKLQDDRSYLKSKKYKKNMEMVKKKKKFKDPLEQTEPKSPK